MRRAAANPLREMAQLTRTPVLLVVDASGSAGKRGGDGQGLYDAREDSGIAGVLVNRVSGAHHYELVRDAVAHYTGLPCVGYIEKACESGAQEPPSGACARRGGRGRAAPDSGGGEGRSRTRLIFR